MFILTFVLNINGWLDLSISALKGLYEWAGGGTEFYKQLDELVNSFPIATKKVWTLFNGLDAIKGCLIFFIYASWFYRHFAFLCFCDN